ncbi:MAG: hypothetical protein ABFR75_14670, partial [Acidobacteriota bacterium]
MILKDKSKDQFLKEIKALKAKISKLEKSKCINTELKLIQQLSFSNALNKIAGITGSEKTPDTILEMSTAVLGETLKSDRSILYNVDFTKRKLIGLCEWINKGVNPTLDTYDISVFKDGINWLWKNKKHLESHA